MKIEGCLIVCFFVRYAGNFANANTTFFHKAGIQQPTRFDVPPYEMTLAPRGNQSARNLSGSVDRRLQANSDSRSLSPCHGPGPVCT